MHGANALQATRIPRMEDVFDHLATPVLLIDRDAVIRRANPAFAAWLVVSVRRFLDQPLSSLAPGEDAFAQLLARARQLGTTVSARRVRVVPALEVERYADATASPWPDSETGLVVLELRPVDEFPGSDPATTMPGALHEALKGLAHEVRNPLAGLRGAAQLLARRIDDADAARYLGVIMAEAERLTALVDRLLKPEPPRAHEPTNVHEVLERVRLLAESDAGWSVVVQRDYDPSLPDIAADAGRLTQAIWNLVRNALEAGSTEIRLRTRAERGVLIGDRNWRLALRIDVSDNGSGVPHELESRVFLPLVSGRADGSGLGLTLAQQVAREHGGNLTYRSRPGHTVFTLLLPVEVAEDAT